MNAVWDATVFTKNRDRLLDGDIADGVPSGGPGPRARRATSSPTITSPSTARCSRRGRVRRVSGGAIRRVIRRQDSSNPTRRLPRRDPDERHASVDDRPGCAAVYQVARERRHAVLHGPSADGKPARPDCEYVGHPGDRDGGTGGRAGHAQRAAGHRAHHPGRRQELRYRADFVRELRELGVTPHVAQFPETPRRGSAIDARTTRHSGYDLSQRKRKLVEQAFGWMKTIGPMRKLHHRGGPLVSWNFTFAAAAYNLVRLRRLLLKPV